MLPLAGSVPSNGAESNGDDNQKKGNDRFEKGVQKDSRRRASCTEVGSSLTPSAKTLILLLSLAFEYDFAPSIQAQAPIFCVLTVNRMDGGHAGGSHRSFLFVPPSSFPHVVVAFES